MALPSRPEPMNATSHHPKVRTTLRFADPLFVAGGAVSGKMEVECRTEKELGVGVIMVELFAIEELTSRDHSATQTFLHTRRIFQGPGLPPSNSVHPHPLPGESLLPAHYHHARRGTTTFWFRLPLPKSSPSAIDFGSGLAQLRYEVRATVGVIWKGQKQLVTDRQQVDVVESFCEDIARNPPEGVAVGENGKIWLQGRVMGDFVVAGQPVWIEVMVKNHSTKKNTGLSISLIRDLRLPGFQSAQKQPLQVTDTLTFESFRGADHTILPGTEAAATIMLNVPEHARTVKGGRREGDEETGRSSECLFQVRCVFIVKLVMGFGSKDVELELPVSVLDPAALPEDYIGVPMDSDYVVANVPPHHALPISPIPYVNPSTPSYDYSLSASPPILPFVDQGQVWLPSPSATPLHYPPLSASLSQQPYLYPSLAVGPPVYATPHRPSSAQPVPSQSLYLDGTTFPPLSMHHHHHHHLPPVSETQQSAELSPEREEGKGERASRIAQHLRMTSRHRSVSPPSHRYQVSTSHAVPVMYAETTEQPRQLSLSPASPGLLVAEHILQDSLSPEAGEVVSPRPLLSPKQSFSVDPFTHTTFSKSERVEALERMAAETVQANANMSNSVPDISLDKDKTLPAPPVPSSKTKPVDIRPKINSLFPLSADEGVTPPTPTIAALSPKASRGFSGLDALEARLLFDVGTRKAKLEEKKHDGPSIQPINIPRPTDVQNLPIDSAISSLSLPGLGAEEGTLRLGEANSSPATSQRAGDFKAAHKPALERPSESSKTHEARVRKKSGPRSRHSAKEQEQFQRLRKAAEGRVAAWLGSIDPEIPPSTTTPPQDDHLPLKPEPNITASLEKEAIPETPLKVAEREHSSEARVGTSPGTRSSGFRLLKANNEASSTTSAHDVTAKPAKDAGADRNIKRKQLPAFLPLPADPEVHYDVRSARGGRGGKVTAVAALWASAAQKPSDLSPSPSARSTPRPQLAKPVVSKKINTNASPLTTSANTAEFKTLADRPSPLPQEAAQETNHRRPRTKATSLPAIMSSSLATPMLSSTASLAKPPPALGDRIRLQNKLPPTISESSAPPKVPPKTEMAFGQARLRELIKKYQG